MMILAEKLDLDRPGLRLERTLREVLTITELVDERDDPRMVLETLRGVAERALERELAFRLASR